jgi:hypothetical protein
MRGGLLPQSYVYPATMRSTRDVLHSIDGQNDTLAGTILAAICRRRRFGLLDERDDIGDVEHAICYGKSACRDGGNVRADRLRCLWVASATLVVSRGRLGRP